MHILRGAYHYRAKPVGFRDDYCVSCRAPRRSIAIRSFDVGHSLLDSDFARRFLEALGVQCVWPQAPFEGAPFSMERPLFLDWRFRPLLGPPGRFGVCLGQLDRPTGGSGGRNFSYDSSASNGNAALGSQEPGVDSAHRGYRLSVLFHSFGCGYGQPVVVPRLQRRPILKINGANGACGFTRLPSCFTLFAWTLLV